MKMGNVMRAIMIAAAAGAWLGGCATTGTTAKGQSGAAQPLDLANSDAGAKGLGPLNDASLPPKACGMVLWTLEGSRPAAVFRFLVGGEAVINLGDIPITLTRTDYDGASGYGVFERQLFTSSDGVEVEVTARFGLGFTGGSYLEQGLVKVRDAAGWSIISPAAGIAGCRG